jgi:hypothetical protein
MDSEGFALLSAIASLVILITFTGLLWAAVQDGRDEQRFRAGRRR